MLARLRRRAKESQELADDQVDGSHQKRTHTFYSTSMEFIEKLRDDGKLWTIDASKGADKVHGEAEKVLGKVLMG